MACWRRDVGGCGVPTSPAPLAALVHLCVCLPLAPVSPHFLGKVCAGACTLQEAEQQRRKQMKKAGLMDKVLAERALCAAKRLHGVGRPDCSVCALLLLQHHLLWLLLLRVRARPPARTGRGEGLHPARIPPPPPHHPVLPGAVCGWRCRWKTRAPWACAPCRTARTATAGRRPTSPPSRRPKTRTGAGTGTGRTRNGAGTRIRRTRSGRRRRRRTGRTRSTRRRRPSAATTATATAVVTAIAAVTVIAAATAAGGGGGTTRRAAKAASTASRPSPASTSGGAARAAAAVAVAAAARVTAGAGAAGAPAAARAPTAAAGLMTGA